jgi:hypothetical protein
MLVFSSLQDVSRWCNGKYKHVYHLEYEAQNAKYAAEAHVELRVRMSIFRAGWFLSGCLTNPVCSMGSSALIRGQLGESDTSRWPVVLG